MATAARCTCTTSRSATSARTPSSAAGSPESSGAALAFKLRGEKRVAVAYLGDGATNTGSFHESLNLAQLWKVPAIFVLENNGWAESTPASQQLPLPVEELGKRAARLRDEAHRGRRPGRRGRLPRDARGARARPRRQGPGLLHLRTHRLTGHYVGDPQVYRDKEALKDELRDEGPDPAARRASRDRRRGVRRDRRGGDGRGRGGGRVREGRHRPGSRGRAQVRLCLS